jgi:hypothetical protein
MSETGEIRHRKSTDQRVRFHFAWQIALAWAVYASLNIEAAERYDPFEARPRFHDPFDAEPKPVAKQKQNSKKRTVRDPFDDAKQAASTRAPLESLYEPRKQDSHLRRANFQFPADDVPAPRRPLNITAPEDIPGPAEQTSETTQSVASNNDPCAAAAERPLAELGISIEPPAGQLPMNRAAVCWESINSNAGPLAGARCWTGFNYQWDSTSFYHRPLYFEEINLERYGYGCGWCLQPGASAAHFFGTVPALPYLMTVDCPHECIYTLGHYRPGSCPPWRRHWPPCDPLASADCTFGE